MLAGVVEHLGQRHGPGHPPAAVLGDDVAFLELDVESQPLPARSQALDAGREGVERDRVVGQRLGALTDQVREEELLLLDQVAQRVPDAAVCARCGGVQVIGREALAVADQADCGSGAVPAQLQQCGAHGVRFLRSAGRARSTGQVELAKARSQVARLPDRHLMPRRHRIKPRRVALRRGRGHLVADGRPQIPGGEALGARLPGTALVLIDRFAPSAT